MSPELLDQKLTELEKSEPNKALLPRVMDLQKHKGLRDDAEERIHFLMQSILQSAPTPRALPSGYGPTQPSGTIGLKNSGTDCFMNVLVQLLFGDPEIREIILKLPPASEKDFPLMVGQQETFRSYKKEMTQLIWKYTEAIRKGEKEPLDIGRHLRKKLQLISGLAGPGAINFNDGAQHDLTEALKRFFLPFDAAPFTPRLKKEYTLENGRKKTLSALDPVLPLAIEITLNDTTTCLFEDQLEHYLTEHPSKDFFAKEEEDGEDFKVSSGVSKFLGNFEYVFIQFKRFKDGNTKIHTKIYLKETFFIHPKHVEEGQGGEFQVLCVGFHEGETPIGGHFYAYRKQAGAWYKFDDEAVSEVKDKDNFIEDLQSCYCILAKRIKGSENKNINAKIQARREESFPIEIEDTLKKKDEIKSLNLFRKALEKKPPNEKDNNKIFKALPPEAQAFFRNFVQEGKALTTLNGVQCKLTSDIEVIDHIVAQYQWLRKQRAEFAKLDRRCEQIYGQTLKKAEYEIEAKRAHLTYQDLCYNHLKTVSREHFDLVALSLFPTSPPTSETRERAQKRASEALQDLEVEAKKLQKLQEEIQQTTADIFSKLDKI